ncbi:MAG: hypothetical protein ACXAC8_12755 [Candidatus Hodarchaeales archaeon]|jgi:drug/metabolite transporter (DMT)-like permease
MDRRIIGAFLVAIGLFIAGFGGTMSDWRQTLSYIVGFLIALVGAAVFRTYYRPSNHRRQEL